ncbi:serine hydrolase domain-containing protein [Paenibacillus sp. SYP-B4298]|uniref:serine hydrolase domain-containing protein n=1 Tax=Paenibacillus sp. SYP-B4298 TaxID=2996034 RepID=UPI0022DD3A5C|nr:serine hydrolase [Paenibacillus sp. SYP-B4298]
MSKTAILPRSTPELQGVAPAGVLQFIEDMEQKKLELHGFILLRHGHRIAQGWWKPYGPQDAHAVYSLTKSITSMAIGVAVQEGLIAEEGRVLDYLSDLRPPGMNERFNRLTIKHLLTMTTGHREDTTRFIVTPAFMDCRTTARIGDCTDGDDIRGFMELPIEAEPGTHFLYNSGASHLLGAILERVSGSKLADYVQTRLFDPLGIQRPRWEHAPGGVAAGGWGLWLRTEDVARFGELLLRKGRWQGQQLVPQAWIERATACQVDNGKGAEQTGANVQLDWEQGYGYQFWRCRHQAFRADGAFGQYCIVLPEYDAVLAIHGGLNDMQAVLDGVWEHLLTAMNTDKSVLAVTDPADGQWLAAKLASLELGPISGTGSEGWTGRRCYELEDNELGLKQIALTFSDNRCILEWAGDQRSQQLICGLGNWQMNHTAAGGVSHAKGGWQDAATFVLHHYPQGSPHYDRCLFVFDKQNVEIHYEHLSFHPIYYRMRGITSDI